MNILVINCGSSSLKFQLIDAQTEKLIAKGLCERIGIEGSQITYAPTGGDKKVTITPMKDHTDAIRLVLDALTDKASGVVKSLDDATELIRQGITYCIRNVNCGCTCFNCIFNHFT